MQFNTITNSTLLSETTRRYFADFNLRFSFFRGRCRRSLVGGVDMNRCVATNGQLGFRRLRMRFQHNSNCLGGHLVILLPIYLFSMMRNIATLWRPGQRSFWRRLDSSAQCWDSHTPLLRQRPNREFEKPNFLPEHCSLFSGAVPHVASKVVPEKTMLQILISPSAEHWCVLRNFSVLVPLVVTSTDSRMGLLLKVFQKQISYCAGHLSKPLHPNDHKSGWMLHF